MLGLKLNHVSKRGHWWGILQPMMTSSKGNIFCVTGPLCEEFTGYQWIPSQRRATRGFDVFFDLRLKNIWVSNRDPGDLRCYCTHYDVTVMHVAIAPQYCCGPQTLSQDIFSHPSGIYHEGWLETSGERKLRPLLPTWTLISAWIRNHKPSNMWDEITYPFSNINGCTIKVWEWISNSILYFIIMNVIDHPFWDW